MKYCDNYNKVARWTRVYLQNYKKIVLSFYNELVYKFLQDRYRRSKAKAEIIFGQKTRWLPTNIFFRFVILY